MQRSLNEINAIAANYLSFEMHLLNFWVKKFLDKFQKSCQINFYIGLLNKNFFYN